MGRQTLFHAHGASSALLVLFAAGARAGPAPVRWPYASPTTAPRGARVRGAEHVRESA